MRRSFLTAAALAGLPLALGAVAPAAIVPFAMAQTMPPSASAGAYAAGTPARHARVAAIEAKFAANTTHDGRLTLAQARAGRLPLIVANFQVIDIYGRGYVTFNDIMAWRMDEMAARLHQRAQALRAQD